MAVTFLCRSHFVAPWLVDYVQCPYANYISVITFSKSNQNMSQNLDILGNLDILDRTCLYAHPTFKQYQQLLYYPITLMVRGVWELKP